MRTVILLAVLLTATACRSTTPAEALQLREESLAQRQLETRRFETTDELALLRAGLIVLQDEGFQFDEMEADLGVVAASMSRATWSHRHGYSTRVSMVSHPTKEAVAVRVTLYQQMGRRSVRLSDPRVYQSFFRRLSDAVFLEAQAP